MFEEMSRLAERLSRVAPTEAEVADPDQPLPDRMRALVDELAMQQRVTAASEGRSMVIMAELCKWAEQWQHIHDPKLLDELGADDLVAAEIAPALHLAPVTAAIRIRTAVEISTRLPATLAAMCRGDLDKGRVLAIREAVAELDDDLTAKVECKVLPAGHDQTAGELRRALTKAVIAVDPEAAERRRKYAVRDRSVSRWTRRDGTGAIEAVLSAVDSGEIYDLIDEVARRTKTTQDTRSMAARRADAFVHLFLGRDPHLGLDDDPPPGPAPSDRELPPDPADTDIRPEPGWPAGGGDDHQGFDQPAAPDHATGPVDQDERAWDEPVLGEPVLGEPALVEPADLEPPGPTRSERISELAALALAAMTSRRPPRLPWVAINQTTGPDGTTVPVGELAGYGPVTSHYAQHLLAAGAAVVPPPTPSGRVPTAAQARTHDPPAWLDREVRDRDGTCRFPGCARAAHRVDLDHTVEFPRGPTVRENLSGVCRRHHRIKTDGAWQLEQTTDGTGTMTWTSRVTGRRYTTHPRGTTGEWQGTTSNHS